MPENAKCIVELRAVSPDPTVADALSGLHTGSLFTKDGDDWVMHTPDPFGFDVNRQLDWMYHNLSLYRKSLKRMLSDDLQVLVRIVVYSNASIQLKPESLLLMHVFGLPMEIVTDHSTATGNSPV